MSLARSLDDLILDGIIAKITRHRDADVILYPALTYDIERGKTTPWESALDARRPLVDCSLNADTPAGRDYTASYKIALFVPTLDDGETADLRLAVLKEQIRLALMDRADYDLGQPTGSLAKISKPTWSRSAFDDAELETSVLVGSWSLDVTYLYDPAEITGPALTQISIELGRFAGLYNVGGTP